MTALSWREPEPFVVGCPVPFPVEVLPAGMAEAVREVAEAVQVDTAIPATAFLGVAAGLVGMRTRVRINPTWSRRCNLYLVVVAETGVGKTPGMVPAMAPMVALENAAREDADHQRSRAQALLPALTDRLKQARKGQIGEEELVLLQKEVECLERDLRRTARVQVDDVTPERLAAMMADNDGRMIAWNDEGAMLKHALGLYAIKPNLDLFLKSWDGTRYVTDRKGGAGQQVTQVVMEHPLLTLVAAVQPVTVRELGEPRNRDLVERGLVGRLLVSWPPSRVGTRRLADREQLAYREVGEWNKTVTRLASEGEHELSFSPEAWRTFVSWHDQVEGGLPLGQVYGEVTEFAVKARDSVARIAGLFARLDGDDQVLPVHVERAVKIGKYYLTHATAVVEAWAGDATAIAQKILNKINKLNKSTFTVREATRWSRAKVDQVIEALEILDAKGYVRPADPEIGFQGRGGVGGKSPEVLVNPAVTALSPAVPAVTWSGEGDSKKQ